MSQVPEHHPEVPAQVLLLAANFGSDEETLEFVKRALALPGAEAFHVVVVDNTPRKDPCVDLEHWASAEPRGTYMLAPRNLGYFGAAAFGFEEFVSRHGLPSWTVVTNTDILFPQPDVLARISESRYGEDVLVLAPKVRSVRKGHDQNPHMEQRPTRTRMRFLAALSSSYLAYSAYQLLSHAKGFLKGSRERSGRASSDQAMARSIYAPHGSFVCFSRRYFEAGGRLEYGGFLFGEEVFVAEEVRRLGGSVWYDSGLEVDHAEHLTTAGRTPWLRSRRIVELVHRGRTFLLEEYFQ